MNEEDYIEKIIRENRDKFVVYDPPKSHKQRFLFRLNMRIRHAISIVPYMLKVAFVTLLIFISSIMIWNNFIRKDRDYMTLRAKFYVVVHKILK
jgi:hypothetical protein